MLQIHIDNIECISSYGYEDSIHNIIGTMHAVTQHQYTCSYGRSVLQATHELSASVIISLFCESGLLQGNKTELRQVQQMFSGLGPRRDCLVVNNVTIAGVLRHVTSVVMRGNMFSELPIVRDICCQNGASGISGLETESWSSFQDCVCLGEVLRLSFVLEENLKKRAIVDDHLIDVIMHEVIENALVVLQNMPHREPPLAGYATEKSTRASFSQTISRSMVDTIVSAVLRMEKPGKVQYAHSLFCVNLLELYGEQYMQWGAQESTKRVRQPKQKHENHNAFRILAKQALLIKTINLHGLEMVQEQVRKMIKNVSGLFSHNTEITCCTRDMNMHIDASLHVLCTDQTSRKITRAVLEYDNINKGIHLLRKSAPSVPRIESGTKSVEQMRFESHELSSKAWQVQSYTTEMIPSNLWYILKNIKPMLSNIVSEGDPRRDIISRLRQSLVLLYLEIVYNLWTTQYVPVN